MNHKKVFTQITIAVLVSMLGIFVAGAQDNPSALRVSLASDVSQVTVGQEFAMNVKVEGAEKVYGGSVKLTYDAQTLEVVLGDNNLALTPGAFFAEGPSFTLKNVADAATGTLEYALTLTQPAQPVSGEGVLGTVKFRALKDGAVNVTPVEASLVSPVFSEVNGQLIAQSINQVQAQVAGLTITVGAGAASASVASAPVSVDQPAVNAAVTVPVASGPTSGNANLSLVLAGVLFLTGLGLFMVSVGMYSRMRINFSFAGDRLTEQAS